MGLVEPICRLDQIDNEDAGKALIRWNHKMGPCNRPMGIIRSHGLFHQGTLVAVVVTADLVNETCAGLSRSKAIELARLCAERPDLCRVVLRLWREFIFPCFGKEWAVSYQDEALHTGDTYRFDGWVRLARSHSGTDQRSGRKGRNKTIWGWHPDPYARRAVTASS